jgi:hypothetical protein
MSDFPKRLQIVAMMFVMLFACMEVTAQSWLPGYNYRKKITIKKALVAGTLDLLNFQLLVSLEDADLTYLPGRSIGNKISSTKGLDFAFTLVSAPAVPLNYQLDTYQPATGKLISWVKVPSLAANGSTTAATELYLYYGSNTIHFPDEPEAFATWSTDLTKVWHMNADAPNFSNKNAKNKLPADRLVASSNMGASNYVLGKVGTAVTLNGINQSMASSKESNNNFYISFWFKLAVNNREQVIITTDSANIGGFSFKVSNVGQPIIEIRISSVISQNTNSFKFSTNQWYYVSVLHQNGRRAFYINGRSYAVNVNASIARVGGQVLVGKSKGQASYFDGIIDELRMQSLEPTAGWVETSYNNQNDPQAFYTVGQEERNELILPTGIVFNGTINALWTEAGNWNTKQVPGNFEQIILDSATQMRLSEVPDLSLNRLTLYSAAVLNLNQDMEVLGEVNTAQGAKISVASTSTLQLDGNLLNHGIIESTASGGRLKFSGSNLLQTVSGSGLINIHGLEIDQAAKNNTVNLEQALNVTGFVKPVMGQLNANGFLTLKRSGNASAFLWPISDLRTASVLGEVSVEQYVSGNFPAPATARGWRLWSAPVYHGDTARPYYHLYDFKQQVYVTGPGGSRNGFDDSPQNGHTIYTHNQATPGTLSQKYSGIPLMNTAVNTGKGVYVYSRGDRHTAGSYVQQIQVAPFQNPVDYVIVHKGLLFQGTLEVEVQSRNQSEAGDGFNLLGNPYAAPLRWGNVVREGTGPFIWKFNPLNNAYDVSDDVNTIIAAGEGFFVKVLNGTSQGTVVFREEAKALESIFVGNSTASSSHRPASGQFEIRSSINNKTSMDVGPIGSKLAATKAPLKASTAKLNVVLSRDVFKQQYSLLLEPSGNEQVDDQDAAAIGTGYVSIASIAAAGAKLSVDSRAMPDRRSLEVPFYVKGYITGQYQLSFFGVTTLPDGATLTLVDQYLKTRTAIKEGQVYDFDLHTEISNSFGGERFLLVVKAAESPKDPLHIIENIDASQVIFYPNPFKDYLKLKLPAAAPVRLGLQIRDLMGQLVLRVDLGPLTGQEPVNINTNAIPSGTYLLDLINLSTNQRIKSTKVIKQ